MVPHLSRAIGAIVLVFLLATATLATAQPTQFEAGALSIRQYLPIASQKSVGNLFSVLSSVDAWASPCAANAPEPTNGLNVWMANATPHWQPGYMKLTICAWLIRNGWEAPGEDVFPSISWIGTNGFPADMDWGRGTLDEHGRAEINFLINTIQPESEGVGSVRYGDQTVSATFHAVLDPGTDPPPPPPPDICVTTNPRLAEGIQVWMGTTTPRRNIPIPICFRLVQNGKYISTYMTGTIRAKTIDGVMHEYGLGGSQSIPYVPSRLNIEFGDLAAVNEPVDCTIVMTMNPSGPTFTGHVRFTLKP